MRVKTAHLTEVCRHLERLAAKDEFTVLIAHEFFDALPIHIFEVREPRSF